VTYRKTSQPAADNGETLVEILVAVAIMGIAMIGLVASLATGVVATDSHRRLTDVEVVGRAYGEALVNQAMQPATTTLASIADARHITVSSAAGFPASGNFDISIDAEVVTVTGGAGSTSWTLASPGMVSSHAAGDQVVGYNSCPTATQLTPTFTVPATAKNVNLPTVTGVEYFASDGTAIAAGSCSNYWVNVAEPCHSFDPADQPHQTNCDPALIRATISVTSSDTAASGKNASTTTRVLIRRGNA